MRRAAMAVVVVGYAFGAFGGIGPVIGHREPAAPSNSTKTVQYRGYELSVPADWPVYRMGGHSSTCVRYDQHAVYVGVPGTDQQCPPGLVGRTETVSIGDLGPGARPPVVGQRVPLSGRAPLSGRVPAQAQRVVYQNARQRMFNVVLPGGAPAITATYGSDPGLVERVLASVRHVELQAAGRADPVPGARPDTVAVDVVAASPSPTAMTAWPSAVSPSRPSASAAAAPLPTLAPSLPVPAPTLTPVPVPTPTPVASAPPAAVPAGTRQALASTRPPLAGFDTCTAPSLRAMRAWRAKFAATNIYIGGEEMACGYGNLSAAWIKAAKAMGWSLLPTYVGLQAGCNDFSGKISLKKAVAQGTQAADDAIASAALLGMGTGTPIYYDMEAYNIKKARCVRGVLTFLDAWTRELRANGYVSGVYSSAGSGIMNVGTAATIDGHQFVRPQALWVALWDNASNLDATPYLPAGLWPAARMSKQFSGSHWVKVGHFALDIDSDLVNSAVVRLRSAPAGIRFALDHRVLLSLGPTRHPAGWRP